MLLPLNIKIKKFSGFIVFLFVFMAITAVFEVKAEKDQSSKISISVAPHTFEFSLKKGGTIKDKLRITNQSNILLPITVKTSDFTAAQDSGQMIIDDIAEDPSVSAKSWIKIEEPNFTLNPGESKLVDFLIQVPDNAEPGGKYFVLLFEPRFSSQFFKEGESRAIPVVGTLFLLSVEVENLKRPEEKLTVLDFNISEQMRLKKLENIFFLPIAESSHLFFNLKIQNNDFYHVKLEGKLTVSQLNGKIIGESQIDKITILPEKARIFPPIEFKPKVSEKLEKRLPSAISKFIFKNLLFGRYEASLSLTSPTGNDKIEQTIKFFIFPWKFLFSAFLLISLICFFIVKYGKRLKLAFKIIFKKKT